MLDWLSGKKKRVEFPEYSRLRKFPSRALPTELVEMESSGWFKNKRDALEHKLLTPSQAPPADKPLFTELVVSDDESVVTIPLPDDQGKCLPVFSSHYRAADYIQTLLAEVQRVQYLASSPTELCGLLRDLLSLGIESFVLDRCPRCPIFTTIGSRSAQTVNDLLQLWSISKAGELARADLYFAYALRLAREGQLEIAREVALEAVGHVTFENLRLHLLLGQIAVAMNDRRLLEEAKTFLQFFNFTRWERRLDQIARRKSPNFEELE